MRPPERVLPEQAVLFEVRPHAPPFVVRERVTIFLEQRVDPRNPAVPRVLEILQRESPVLRLRLLPLQRVFRPHALRVVELRLPRLNVPIQVWNQLVLVVGHPAAEVRHAGIRLHAVLQVGLRDQDVTHGQHPEAANLLRGVEHHGRETRRHLGVQTNLDARLDLILALHEKIQELLGVHHGLAVVRHQSDERRVPLVGDLRKRRRPRGHQHLPDSVLELLEGFVVHA
mmetsp:Transcript_3094/g.10260  ORF Transcript_3094/g.10260 Transcript_3094/m.10260 type:complete len:228 (-) Transcript_3094:3866-4549(-)